MCPLWQLGAQMSQHPLVTMPKPWALLSQGAAPTVAHWLEGVVEQSSETLIPLNPERPTAVAAATVIVVRTIPHCWLKPLRVLHQRGLQVVLLLDDDLLTPDALVGLPWRYRWRLWRDMTRHRWQRRACLFALALSLASFARYDSS